MVEPTEQASQLDQFCDAMIAIRAEIKASRTARWTANNPLKNAAHRGAVTGQWDRPYSREQAALPGAVAARPQYWPPVARR
jgi:glycine dehydrogenase